MPMCLAKHVFKVHLHQINKMIKRTNCYLTFALHHFLRNWHR